MNDENKVTQTVKAIEGVAKAVPIYQDALQPAAKQIGKGLETITKAINVVLSPISGLVWGYDHIQEFIESKIAEKLKNVPEDRIQTPSPLVAGPLLESLRYTGHEETLRELYANLLATSIDSKTVKNAHPGFVPILQSMSPDEAKIMRLFTTKINAPLIDVRGNTKPEGFITIIRNFSSIGHNAGCAHPELTSNYLDNLIRLGLLEIPPDLRLISDSLYEALQDSPELTGIKQQVEASDDLTLDFDKKKIHLTDLGKQFCAACVTDKNVKS